MVIQPTAPFRGKEIIDNSISKLISSQKNSLISVKKINHQYHPNWQFKLNIKEDNLIFMKIISRRQDLDDTFIRDGSIYLARCDFLLLKNTFFDKKIDYIIDNESPYINIDTHNDLKKAIKYVKKKY